MFEVMKEKNKKVAILMATYNGMPWLVDQIKSIQNQIKVDIELFVSDDGSTDGTYEYIQNLKLSIPVNLLSRNIGMKSASLNFFRLIKDVDFATYDYVFLSDQDDEWYPNKVIKAIESIKSGKVECYASNLICTYQNKTKKILRKDYLQTENDFLFQSASAGCTYGLSVSAAVELQKMLNANNNLNFIDSSHDWIIYAYTRSIGLKWLIDANSYIEYRQHPKNVWGALGFKSYLKRWKMLRGGWYRKKILEIGHICTLNSEQIKIINNISGWSLGNRIQLMIKCFNFRRKFSENMLMVILILFGLM